MSLFAFSTHLYVPSTLHAHPEDAHGTWGCTWDMCDQGGIRASPDSAYNCLHPLSTNIPVCRFTPSHQDLPDGYLQTDVSDFVAVPQHKDFSSARAGGAHEMPAVLRRALLCRVCALSRVLPRRKGNLHGCVSTTFLAHAGDTGLLVQHPGSGQWRAPLDIHTNTHTHSNTPWKKKKKRKKNQNNDCREGILPHCCL